MAKDIKQTLAKNVDLLAKKRFGDRYQGLLVKAGIKNANVTRVLEGRTSVGLDLLQALADALGVKPYQLLCEIDDADNLPVTVPKQVADEARAGAIALEALRKISQASSQ